MCGKPYHSVYFYKEEQFCCMSTMCDSWPCSEDPELCPHEGVGDCTCGLEDEDDEAEGSS